MKGGNIYIAAWPLRLYLTRESVAVCFVGDFLTPMLPLRYPAMNLELHLGKYSRVQCEHGTVYSPHLCIILIKHFMTSDSEDGNHNTTDTLSALPNQTPYAPTLQEARQRSSSQPRRQSYNPPVCSPHCPNKSTDSPSSALSLTCSGDNICPFAFALALAFALTGVCAAAVATAVDSRC